MLGVVPLGTLWSADPNDQDDLRSDDSVFVLHEKRRNATVAIVRSSGAKARQHCQFGRRAVVVGVELIKIDD
jgi:hypothetical protein